ncbi:MAG: PEP-CTERM sorting domain-containing protein [Phycisphaerae bacterium]
MSPVTPRSVAVLFSTITAALLGSAAQAQLVNLTANDGFGNSSFNSAGNWSNAAAPSAGNTYTNLDSTGAGHLLRTPASAGDFTFGGDSLTLSSSSVTDLNQSLIFKGSGGSATAPNTITVNNLILDGGIVRQGNGEGDFFALAGNVSVTSNGGTFDIQGPTYITAPISGSGPLGLNNPGSDGVARTLHFDSNANTWTGTLTLASGPRTTKFELDSTGLMNFVIGANGINNSVAGTGIATYDGTFNFDLSGADNTVGDQWVISSIPTILAADNITVTNGQIYTATFNVAGFTNSGSGLWDKTANGVDYQFNQATSTLSVVAVPEPASLAIAALGALALIGRRRR